MTKPNRPYVAIYTRGQNIINQITNCMSKQRASNVNRII